MAKREGKYFAGHSIVGKVTMNAEKFVENNFFVEIILAKNYVMKDHVKIVIEVLKKSAAVHVEKHHWKNQENRAWIIFPVVTRLDKLLIKECVTC